MPQNDPYRMLSDLRNLIAVLDRRIAQAQKTDPSTPDDLIVKLHDLRKRTLELAAQIMGEQISRV
jgi:hypothetical protein